jgi:hypothetical protein
MKNLILLILVLAWFFCTTCTKYESLDSKLAGLWELEQLIIDGHDTTASIKRDSSCYAYTKFWLDEETGRGRLGLQPFYHFPSHPFSCDLTGTYFYYGPLRLTWFNFFSIGPYLSREDVRWQILGPSDGKLKLYVMYHSCHVI